MKAFKNIIVLCTFLCISLALNSQNYIAVQHGTTLTQYTTLDAAITGAQSGDNVYIPGGSFTLSTNISKKLFIYGAGHYPDSTLVTNKTIIQNAVTVVSGADGGLITGVHIAGTMKFGTSQTDQIVDDYTILRCKIDGELKLSFDGTTTTLANSFYISENVIKGAIRGGNAQGVYIVKNIVESSIMYFGNGGNFSNNIFLYAGETQYCWGTYYIYHSFFGWDNPTTISNCIFENNIIFIAQPFQVYIPNNNCILTPTNNCIANNNIFLANFSFPVQTNIGTNNIVNQPQSSIFINQSGNLFSYSHDYHLKSTCPGKNAGTDGTDIGIYGTGQPYKAGAVPANPHIRQKIITTQNNQINVNIKVAAQDR